MLKNTYIKCGVASAQLLRKFFNKHNVDIGLFNFLSSSQKHCYGVTSDGDFGCYAIEFIEKMPDFTFLELVDIENELKDIKNEIKDIENPIEVPRKYWYVIGRNNGKLPTFKHPSLESAEAEAKRLVDVGKVDFAEIVECVGVVLVTKNIKTYKLV